MLLSNCTTLIKNTGLRNLKTQDSSYGGLTSPAFERRGDIGANRELEIEVVAL